MACNVFGHPITNETLTALPKYKDKTPTRSDRALEAFRMKSNGGKDVKARNYLGSLRHDWDDYVEKIKPGSTIHDKACCLVLIYNATGDTLTYATSYDFKGNIGRAPYPSSIANGQWGAFLHVQTINTTTGCKAAVVYRGTLESKSKLDWMLGWHNPGFSGSFKSIIYGEVRAADYFTTDSIWTSVSANMEAKKAAHYRDEPGNGGVFDGTTGRGVASIYEAILK